MTESEINKLKFGDKYHNRQTTFHFKVGCTYTKYEIVPENGRIICIFRFSRQLRKDSQIKYLIDCLCFYWRKIFSKLCFAK